MSRHTVSLTVNDVAEEVEVPANRLLADLLRDDLGLTGTKRGCETGICGACTVLVDGKAMKSCLLLALQVRDRSVTTIEGIGSADALHPVQQAFVEHGGLQCGFCTPGFVMMSVALLKDNPKPDEEEVRRNLNGNLCRCTGYNGIVESVLAAAEKIDGV
jgi:carbon-monoxide dehydrogenase small subunit